MMVFCIASFLRHLLGTGRGDEVAVLTVHMHIVIWQFGQRTTPCIVNGATYTSPARSSKVSPFRGGAKALRTRFIAIVVGSWNR